MKRTILSLKRCVNVFLACLLLVVSLTFGNSAQAKSINLEESLTEAGADFVSSVVDDYTKFTQSSLKEQYKVVKQTVKELTSQLEKAASPTAKATDTTAIGDKLALSQTTLQQAADAFKTLADQSGQFDTQLESSVKELLTTAKTQLKEKMAGSQDAFLNVSKALEAIAADTKSADTSDLAALQTKLTEDVTALTQAIEAASTALKGTSS